MLWLVLWVELGGVGEVKIWTYSGCGERLQAFVTLGNFVATQFARKVARCNIPCHGHSSQHFCWYNRCEKQKPVMLWATRLAMLQVIFQSLRSVTSSLQLVSQRSAVSSNEILPTVLVPVLHTVSCHRGEVSRRASVLSQQNCETSCMKNYLV